MRPLYLLCISLLVLPASPLSADQIAAGTTEAAPAPDENGKGQPPGQAEPVCAGYCCAWNGKMVCDGMPRRDPGMTPVATQHDLPSSLKTWQELLKEELSGNGA